MLLDGVNSNCDSCENIKDVNFGNPPNFTSQPESDLQIHKEDEGMPKEEIFSGKKRKRGGNKSIAPSSTRSLPRECQNCEKIENKRVGRRICKKCGEKRNASKPTTCPHPERSQHRRGLCRPCYDKRRK